MSPTKNSDGEHEEVETIGRGGGRLWQREAKEEGSGRFHPHGGSVSCRPAV
jgi:hypothetical protein